VHACVLIQRFWRAKAFKKAAELALLVRYIGSPCLPLARARRQCWCPRRLNNSTDIALLRYWDARKQRCLAARTAQETKLQELGTKRAKAAKKASSKVGG
jgi:hypothetical protein